MKKRSRSHHVKPLRFMFESFGQQTSVALNILRLLERVCEDHHTTSSEFDIEEVDAMALLLYHANLFLRPLDIPGVAAAMDYGRFTMIQPIHGRALSIGCARCDKDYPKSESSREGPAAIVAQKAKR